MPWTALNYLLRTCDWHTDFLGFQLAFACPQAQRPAVYAK